jgi:hypothetical protein
MKTALKITIIIVSVLLVLSQVQAGEYWGSKKSNKYHYPDCKWAQKINPANLIKFKSPEDAIKAGYVPCKVCRPPMESTSEIKVNSCHTYAQLHTDNAEERQGCCSWHGGACGCDEVTGRAVCCDGTLSPSCGCQ